MAKTKKQYSPEFKLKVVLEVLKGEKTATQLAGELGVHPVYPKNFKSWLLGCVKAIDKSTIAKWVALP